MLRNRTVTNLVDIYESCLSPNPKLKPCFEWSARYPIRQTNYSYIRSNCEIWRSFLFISIAAHDQYGAEYGRYGVDTHEIVHVKCWFISLLLPCQLSSCNTIFRFRCKSTIKFTCLCWFVFCALHAVAEHNFWIRNCSLHTMFEQYLRLHCLLCVVSQTDTAATEKWF